MEEGCINPLQKTYKYNKKIDPIHNFWNIKLPKLKAEDLDELRQKESKYHQISNSQDFDIKIKDENASSRLNKSLIKDSPQIKNKKKIQHIRTSLIDDIELVKYLVKDDEDKTRELIDKKKKEEIIENYKFKKIEKRNQNINLENLFKINFKKKSNSINSYISRANLKLSLPPLHKIDLIGLYNQSKLNNSNVKRRRSILDPLVKVKLKAKSLDLNNKVNYLKKFYISNYLKKEKEKYIEMKIKEEKEKKERREAFKNRNKKDKYFNPSKNSFTDNMFNFIRNQSPQLKTKRSISIKKFNDDNKVLKSGKNNIDNLSTPLNITNYNSYLLNSNGKSISQESSNYISNTAYSYLTTKTAFKPFHNFSQSISSFKSGNSTFQNTTSIYPKTNLYTCTTTGSKKSKKNIDLSPDRVKKIKMLGKKSNEIFLKCQETGNQSSKIKNEIDSLIHTYHSKDQEFLRSLKTQNGLEEIHGEIQQECLKFKQFDRVFIHPKGLNKKREYISSDQNCAIIQAKRIDSLGSDIAFNSRKLIYNLFDTKIEDGEIINYIPDVHKFSKKSDFIKNNKEQKIKINSINLKKSYNTLKVKNNIIYEKASNILKNLK
jgi:hypothetical protein